MLLGCATWNDLDSNRGRCLSVDQSFTDNKAVINGKTVQIYGWISQPRFTVLKIRPLGEAAFVADCLTSFKILKIITVGLKIDSGNAIKNCYML